MPAAFVLAAFWAASLPIFKIDSVVPMDNGRRTTMACHFHVRNPDSLPITIVTPRAAIFRNKMKLKDGRLITVETGAGNMSYTVRSGQDTLDTGEGRDAELKAERLPEITLMPNGSYVDSLLFELPPGKGGRFFMKACFAPRSQPFFQEPRTVILCDSTGFTAIPERKPSQGGVPVDQKAR